MPKSVIRVTMRCKGATRLLRSLVNCAKSGSYRVGTGKSSDRVAAELLSDNSILLTSSRPVAQILPNRKAIASGFGCASIAGRRAGPGPGAGGRAACPHILAFVCESEYTQTQMCSRVFCAPNPTLFTSNEQITTLLDH